MPRANLTKHLPTQASWDHLHLKRPDAKELVSFIKDLAQQHQGVPVDDLRKLFRVPMQALREHLQKLDAGTGRWRRDAVPLELALEAFKAYLPVALSWKSLTELGGELKIHRNSVESIVQQFGDPKTMLRYAPDHRLYVSPDGEKLVREKKEFFDSLKDLETISQFARRMQVGRNTIAAYLSDQKIKLHRDINGRARLTEEQVSLLVDWRAKVEEKRQKNDLIIDNQRYRSLVRVASERADMYAHRDSKRHRLLADKFESSLRHHAVKAGLVEETHLGAYIPQELADFFLRTINRVAASRLLELSIHTLRAWARKEPSIAAGHLPGKRAEVLSVEPLVEYASQRFLNGPRLRKKPEVPTILVSLPVFRLAEELGSSFSAVEKLLPLSPQEHLLLRRRVGSLPRDTFERISFYLTGTPNQGSCVTLSSEAINEATASAAPLIGLRQNELLILALSRPFAELCGRGVSSLEVSQPLFMNLLRLGSVSKEVFLSTAVVPARHLREILTSWCEKERVIVDATFKLARVTLAQREQILRGTGAIRGDVTLRLLDITRQDRYALLKNGLLLPADLVPLSRGPAFREADKPSNQPEKKFTGVILQELGELRVLANSINAGTVALGVDLDKFRLSSRLLLRLIETAAANRKVQGEQVFDFVKTFFKSTNLWPKTYGDLQASAMLKDEKHLFLLDVGSFLLTIMDPSKRIHVHGQISQTPQIGDILAHPYLADFGPITAIDHSEGGRIAMVKLNARGGILGFRVP